MKIQLLSFEGCPHAPAARAALRAAIRDEGFDLPVEEIDIGLDDAPAWARAWGSPTILIDGEDVAGGASPGGEIGCRLYAGGAPSADQIRRHLHAARERDTGASERGTP